VLIFSRNSVHSDRIFGSECIKALKMTMTVTKASKGHSKNELVAFGDEGKSVSICSASMYLKTKCYKLVINLSLHFLSLHIPNRF